MKDRQRAATALASCCFFISSIPFFISLALGSALWVPTIIYILRSTFYPKKLSTNVKVTKLFELILCPSTWPPSSEASSQPAILPFVQGSKESPAS